MAYLENQSVQALPAYKRWIARFIAAGLLVGLAIIATLSAFFVITLALFAALVFLVFGRYIRNSLRKWAQAKADELASKTQNRGSEQDSQPHHAYDPQTTRRRTGVTIDGEVISRE